MNEMQVKMEELTIKHHEEARKTWEAEINAVKTMAEAQNQAMMQNLNDIKMFIESVKADEEHRLEREKMQAAAQAGQQGSVSANNTGTAGGPSGPGANQ
jgi:uncharacterized protein YjcR